MAKPAKQNDQVIKPDVAVVIIAIEMSIVTNDALDDPRFTQAAPYKLHSTTNMVSAEIRCGNRPNVSGAARPPSDSPAAAQGHTVGGIPSAQPTSRKVLAMRMRHTKLAP